MTKTFGTSSSSLKELLQFYEINGYAVINDFLSSEEIQSLRNECIRLIQEESKTENIQVFGNTFNAKSDYFLTSGDKIRAFFEKNALDLETKKLLVPAEQSLAKIGHALHYLNPYFKEVTTSEKVKLVFKTIGFGEPTVVQSMIIFKNPKVGGQYTPHQDASFLCTEPIHLAGIWLALDDATIENGCLQFIPGSHNLPLARRNVRVDQEKKTETDDSLLHWTAPPQEYEDEQFVSVPVTRGALVLIHGLVVHRSAANNSDKARWIYTFHAYDKSKATYLKDNWLQTTDSDSFMSIYEASSY